MLPNRREDESILIGPRLLENGVPVDQRRNRAVVLYENIKLLTRTSIT